jgi:hypothetical protein
MNTFILFTLLLLVSVAGTESCNPPISDPPCDTTLWSHTYGPIERFGEPTNSKDVPRTKLFHRCVNVRGKVMSVTPDRDGDVKVKLKLFPTNFKPYGPFDRSDLLNAFNERYCEGGGECGRLVVEIVCGVPQKLDKTDPNNQKMIVACQNYTNHVYIPQVGQNVSIIGELVTDTGPSAANPIRDHGWKEIHPATSIRPIN